MAALPRLIPTTRDLDGIFWSLMPTICRSAWRRHWFINTYAMP